MIWSRRRFRRLVRYSCSCYQWLAAVALGQLALVVDATVAVAAAAPDAAAAVAQVGPALAPSYMPLLGASSDGFGRCAVAVVAADTAIGNMDCCCWCCHPTMPPAFVDGLPSRLHPELPSTHPAACSRWEGCCNSWS